ncbi:hypothetical protein RirG_236900 [Rhizophagus irregularis DAOM 197198w]|uniref:Uncharacterized protein n=1 Tax=Rhizophagus irregularis (strain DAOM 197198w) TaxID=1432141 RepID=A0A015JH13_RHIIW|nr:hypothetical protein RirG_236900 [Rhizophagus irregularis DAOM 197198w]
MAPRPGYGIPLDGILPMAAPGSEIEKLPTLFIGGISWKNSQGSDQLFNFWWAMNATCQQIDDDFQSKGWRFY